MFNIFRSPKTGDIIEFYDHIEIVVNDKMIDFRYPTVKVSDINCYKMRSYHKINVEIKKLNKVEINDIKNLSWHQTDLITINKLCGVDKLQLNYLLTFASFLIEILELDIPEIIENGIPLFPIIGDNVSESIEIYGYWNSNFINFLN